MIWSGDALTRSAPTSTQRRCANITGDVIRTALLQEVWEGPTLCRGHRGMGFEMGGAVWVAPCGGGEASAWGEFENCNDFGRATAKICNPRPTA